MMGSLASVMEYIQGGGLPLLLVIILTGILFLSSVTAIFVKSMGLLILQAIGVLLLPVIGYAGYKYSANTLLVAISTLDSPEKNELQEMAMADAYSSFQFSTISSLCLLLLLVLNFILFKYAK